MAATADDESWVAEATYTFMSATPADPSSDYARKEDFTGVAANTGVEYVANENAVYEGDEGNYCLIYNESLAGGTAPEVLVPHKNRPVNSLTANIAIGIVHGNFDLSFKSNGSLTLTSATADVVISQVSAVGNDYRYRIYVPKNTSSLQLTFTNKNTKNVRLDNIILMKPPKGDPELSFSESAINVLPDQEYTLPTLSNPNELPVVYSSSEPTIATIDAETGVVTLTGNEGSTIIKAEFAGNNEFLLSERNTKKKRSIVVDSVKDLQDINKRIYNLGKKMGKMTVATCDVHFMDPEDELYRRIIQSGQDYDDADGRRHAPAAEREQPQHQRVCPLLEGGTGRRKRKRLPGLH